MKRSIFSIFLLTLVLGLPSHGSAEQTLQVSPADQPPVIDGLDNDSAWQNTAGITTFDTTGKIPITIRSVYSDDEIFFLVIFPDPDESRTHKSWLWNQERGFYTVGTDREDIFVFKWNMESEPVDLSIYADNTYTADIWFWKACRTDPVGYADDKSHYLSTTNDRYATEIISRTGKSMYLLRTGDQGTSAYNINLISDYQGNLLPRYTVHAPSGSRGDVRARGKWQDGRWTVEFGRRMTTGNEDDVQFNKTGIYLFGVSRYEIAGRDPNPKLSNPLYGAGDISETLWLKFIK